MKPFIANYSFIDRSDNSGDSNLYEFDYEQDITICKSNGIPVIYSNVSFDLTGSKTTATKYDTTSDESTDRGGI